MPELYVRQGIAQPPYAALISPPITLLPLELFVSIGRQRINWLPQPTNRTGQVAHPPFPTPTPTPSPLTGQSAGEPVVARVPRDDDGTRLKRLADRASDVFNSLGTRGQLLQTNPHTWVMHPRTFEETRAPGANDDRTFGAWPGDTWINTTTNLVYICVRSTTGAAVWVQIG